MSNLQIGQVLSFTLPLNNSENNEMIKGSHPYIIIEVDDSADIVELVQFSSLEGKEFEAINNCNKIIYKENPNETVIDTDSFARLNYKITVDFFNDLINYRRQADRLSVPKLNGIVDAYKKYHKDNIIDDDKIIHVSEQRILELNLKFQKHP
jgi:hypothetical protein